MGDTVTLHFSTSPAGAGTVYVGGTDATDRATEVARGQLVGVHLEPADGYELDNWNNGEWFGLDWHFVPEEDATVVAYMREA